MAKVKSITIGLGYTLSNAANQYDKQEGSMYIKLIDIQPTDDLGQLTRETHRFIFEHLWSTVNHGAVARASAEAFFNTGLRPKDLERELVLHITHVAEEPDEDHDLEYTDDAGTVVDRKSDDLDSVKEKLDGINDIPF